MKAALLAIAVSGCGSQSVPVFCKTICGGFVAAWNPIYSCNDYRMIEALWIGEIQSKIPDACQNVAGYVSWEMPGFSSLIYVEPVTKKELWAVGWTVCEDQRIYFHTGDGYIFKDDTTRKRSAWQTAWSHELTHAAQKCNSPFPTDPGLDDSHSNWNRDDLMNIPSRINTKIESGK